MSVSRSTAAVSAHSAWVGARQSGSSGASASAAWRPRAGRAVVDIPADAAARAVDAVSRHGAMWTPHSSQRNEPLPSASGNPRCSPRCPSSSAQRCIDATSLPPNHVASDCLSGSCRNTVARHLSTFIGLPRIAVGRLTACRASGTHVPSRARQYQS